MALEDLTGPAKFIANLVSANPVSNDDRREGDDHIRGVKNVLRNTFPNVDGAVTLTDEQLNALYVAGVVAALLRANNLSDLASAATARANLAVLGIAANLSDLANAFTARTNIGMQDSSGRWAIPQPLAGGAALTINPAAGQHSIHVVLGGREFVIVEAAAGKSFLGWLNAGTQLVWEGNDTGHTFAWVVGAATPLTLNNGGANTLTQATGDNTTRVATTAHLQASMLAGAARVWTPVLASPGRAFDTDYTAPAYPIQVSVQTSCAAGGHGVNLLVAGNDVSDVTNQGSAAATLMVQAVVPAGASYRLQKTGTPTITRWHELR